MDTANTGNLVWAIAVIGGPILLGIVIAFGLMRRRRRRSPVENAAIAERYKDRDGIVEDGVVRPDPTVTPESTLRPDPALRPDPTVRRL